MKLHLTIFTLFLTLLLFQTGCTKHEKPTDSADGATSETVTDSATETQSTESGTGAENVLEAQFITENGLVADVSTPENASSLEETMEKDFAESLKKADELMKTDADAACRYLQSLTVDYPNRYEPYHLLALHYEQAQDHEAAIALYEEAQRKRPENDVFYEDFGIYLYQTGDFERALSMFQTANSYRPADQKRWRNSALAAAQLGRWEDVFSFFQKEQGANAAKSYTLVAQTQYEQAIQQQSNGQKDAVREKLQLSLETVQKSLALDPTFTPALELRTALEKALKEAPSELEPSSEQEFLTETEIPD